MKKAYLDNAATTKTAPEVIKEMSQYFTEQYGNASCLHQFGQEAREALENARSVIAKKINAEPDEIVFTSGGTESNNFAITGIANALKQKGNHIITSSIEHPAVLEACRALEKQGFRISYIGVDSAGIISLDKLKKEITEKTILVTVMHANNEIGAIQPIEEIGRICLQKNIIFHTDSVQSFGKLDIDVKKANINLASFSAHKIHGPKGIGALFIKKGTKISKLFYGGQQEFNLRPGTENVPGAVGFAKASELMAEKDIKKMAELRDYFIKSVLEKIPGTSINGSSEKRLCNNISIAFENVEGEAVLLSLDEKGIAVTTSSACTSHKLEPSHVLDAIGLSPEKSHGTIRFTLSKYTTKAELNYTIKCLIEIINNLRKISPFRK